MMISEKEEIVFAMGPNNHPIATSTSILYSLLDVIIFPETVIQHQRCSSPNVTYSSIESISHDSSSQLLFFTMVAHDIYEDKLWVHLSINIMC